MIPPCHNRPPWKPIVTIPDGWHEDGRKRFREVPDTMSKGCKVWEGTGIGPHGERYPVAHGWDCRGCRWWPKEHGGTA